MWFELKRWKYCHREDLKNFEKKVFKIVLGNKNQKKKITDYMYINIVYIHYDFKKCTMPILRSVGRISHQKI